MATEKLMEKFMAREITKLYLSPIFLGKNDEHFPAKRDFLALLLHEGYFMQSFFFFFFVMLSHPIICWHESSTFFLNPIGFKRRFSGMPVELIHAFVSSDFLRYHFSRIPFRGKYIIQIDCDALTPEKRNLYHPCFKKSIINGI